MKFISTSFSTIQQDRVNIRKLNSHIDDSTFNSLFFNIKSADSINDGPYRSIILPYTLLGEFKQSAFGIRMIQSFEGLMLKAYLDGSRYSIGYGTISHEGETITKEEAQDRLIKFLVKTSIPFVKKTLYSNKMVCNQNQFDAFIDFAFNRGTGNFEKLIRKSIRNNRIDYEALVYELVSFDDSKSGNLPERRRADALLYTGTLTDNLMAKLLSGRKNIELAI